MMKFNVRPIRYTRAFVALIGLSCGLAGTAPAQRATVSSGLLLTNVTIVDTHTGKLTPGMSVAVDGGRITKIGRAGTLLAKGSARSIDLKGKFVVPGYWEMHGHPIDSPDRADNLALMLANGITGVRQMSGSDALLKERRDGTLMPATDAPELLAMPGSILLRGNAATVPMAVAEVDKQKAEGADFIKTIDVTPQVFFAALEEATKQGLLYDGHLSAGVDAVKASEAGMRVIEHLGPMETILIGCSTDEAAIRQAMAARAAAAAQAPAPPPAATLSKNATSNPVLTRSLADPTALSRTQHILDTYSEEKCRNVAQVFAAHKTWQAPTLIRLRTAEFGDDPTYRENPNLEYVSPATRQLWNSIAQQFTAKMGPADRETLKQMFAVQMKVAKLFEDTGVPMLAGSDFGGMWLVAGFSLHQEFDLLAQAGFTPLQVLQMTTLDGAELLGREAHAGSVEEGKDANLVVLDANPMDSVQNLHKVYAVVRGGNYYSKDALDSLKQKVRKHMESAQAASIPAEKATP
jgi:imidazolonepropionase-like amidohydrolase